MASSDKRRRKQDPLSSPLPTEANEGFNIPFSSSVRPSQTGIIVNRRLRSGSHGSRSTFHVDLATNVWEDIEDLTDDGDTMKGGSSSTPSTIRTRKGSKGNHQRGWVDSQAFHPLASSSAVSRGFNHDRSQSVPSGHSTPLSSNSGDGSWTALANGGDGFGDSDHINGKGKQTDESRIVIVHTVSPLDSLAGVALKYGVELAELKKANKLWSADTIHLRKVLYIPVDAQKWGSKHSMAFDNLIDLDANPEAPNEDELSAQMPKSLESSPSREALDDERPAIPVRRVPASQLSFFPPPSTSPSKQQSSKTQDVLSQSPLRFSSVPRSSGLGVLSFSSSPDLFGLPSSSPSSSSRALPSLFSVFAAPSRVSFSSEADTEVSDEIDVELDNANGWKRKQRSSSVRKEPRRPLEPSSGAVNTIKAAEGLFPTIEDITPRIIRSQQPTPSPHMELPIRRVRS